VRKSWWNEVILTFLCVAFGLMFGARPVIGASPEPGLQMDGWAIETDNIDPKNYFGETVANGMIGLVSSTLPFQSAKTFINGAYDVLRQGEPSCILSGFDFLRLELRIDGSSVNEVHRFHQTLELKGAFLKTSFEVGDKASVIYGLRALRQLPYNALMDITIVAKRPLTIMVASTVSSPGESLLSDVKMYPSRIEFPGRLEPPHLLAASGRTPGGITVAAAQGFIFEEPPDVAPAVMDRTDVAQQQSTTDAPLAQVFSKVLAAGETYRFAIVGATLTSAHVNNPLNEAQRLTAFALVQGTRGLIAQHTRDWNTLWESDIRIDGDVETQRDVHSMLYHLYSFIRNGTGYSIPPMGLSRGWDGYLGHIFWDADTWMLPTLLVLHPDLARTMLDYRYERLPAARRRAAAHGYQGAMFPWESAATGDEDAWSTDLGEFEHHISADVALAAWDYYRVTRDRDWLREKGFPLIQSTADFWVSRVTRNGPGHYDIKHVFAVDEYARDVDNDAFTNAAARENLAVATAAARVLGVTPKPDWMQVRENIPILRFPNGITREHATYGGEQIKQADVSLLSYPLKEITDTRAIRRELAYYEGRTDHSSGPAYSNAALAILYERLGMPQNAFQVFKSGYLPTRRPPFGTLAESAEGQNPYMATSAGGLLQTMLYGFGGLEITDRGLVQRKMKLPRGWKSLTLTGIGPSRRAYHVDER